MAAKVIKKKLCLLGAYCVGKTSLVRRFIDDRFEFDYKSTIGTDINKKSVTIGDTEVLLMIWDVAGEEENHHIPENYVTGAHGFLFVADGTRPETLETVSEIRSRIYRDMDPLPEVLLLNKADLVDEWKYADGEDPAQFAGEGLTCLHTSALDGRNVEAAFLELAARFVESG